jgi:hypothetical protein
MKQKFEPNEMKSVFIAKKLLIALLNHKAFEGA